MGVILSIIAIIILLLRNIEIFIVSNYQIDSEIISLQICHFANFVLFFAFLKDDKVWFVLAFCLNLPAALLSIIFAESLTNYTHLFSFSAQAYIWGHMMIVGITLWAFINEFIVINFKIWVKTIFFKLMFLVSVPVNMFISNLTGKTANYFYSLEPKTPLKLLYSLGKEISFINFTINPIYLLIIIVFGIIVVMFFYVIYFLVNKLFLKRSL